MVCFELNFSKIGGSGQGLVFLGGFLSAYECSIVPLANTNTNSLPALYIKFSLRKSKTIFLI